MFQSFRKKPVVIKAIQWDETKETLAAIKAEGAKNLSSTERLDGSIQDLRINTLEGQHLANPGDWIIKGVQGEFYPCKPDIFDATYDAGNA